MAFHSQHEVKQSGADLSGDATSTRARVNAERHALEAKQLSPAKRLLNKRQVSAKTSLSVRQIDRLIKRGEFPKPLSIGPMRVAWVEAECDAWVDKFIAMRDGAAA